MTLYTETTVWATHYMVTTKQQWERYATQTSMPAGRPLTNYFTYILNPKDLCPVPVGEVGELFIGGAGMTRGYNNRCPTLISSFSDQKNN